MSGGQIDFARSSARTYNKPPWGGRADGLTNQGNGVGPIIRDTLPVIPWPRAARRVADHDDAEVDVVERPRHLRRHAGQHGVSIGSARAVGGWSARGRHVVRDHHTAHGPRTRSVQGLPTFSAQSAHNPHTAHIRPARAVTARPDTAQGQNARGARPAQGQHAFGAPLPARRAGGPPCR